MERTTLGKTTTTQEKCCRLGLAGDTRAGIHRPASAHTRCLAGGCRHDRPRAGTAIFTGCHNGASLHALSLHNGTPFSGASLALSQLLARSLAVDGRRDPIYRVPRGRVGSHVAHPPRPWDTIMTFNKIMRIPKHPRGPINRRWAR